MNTRPRQLRKNASVAENRLWYVLRNRGLARQKFVRQLAVGPYIADFVCRELGLIIEVDGGQHSDSTGDAARTDYLNMQGYSVLRFWNSEVVENMDGVFSAILRVIEGSPSPHRPVATGPPSPTGGGIWGKGAARSSHRQALARSIPLPIGERSPRSGG